MEYSLSLQMSSSTKDEHKHPLMSNHSLHTVRKPPAKPWRRPDLPAAPKVYRVDPHGFRSLVQRLTGKPQSAAAAREAPPPIKVRDQYSQSQTANYSQGVAVSTDEMGISLSPSFYSSWCSFPLLSPGSMAALDS